MALFNFKKKKEEKPCCCCGGNKETKVVDESLGNGMGELKSIKILGAGCKSCHDQYENVKEAVSNMKLSVEVLYITDMEKVAGYGVMKMPAIVVNEKVVSQGKVLPTADVEKMLNKLSGK